MLPYRNLATAGLICYELRKGKNQHSPLPLQLRNQPQFDFKIHIDPENDSLKRGIHPDIRLGRHVSSHEILHFTCVKAIMLPKNKIKINKTYNTILNLKNTSNSLI